MDNSGIIIWKDKAVGTATNITSDMWYLEAKWQPIECDESLRFESLASKLNSENIIKDPAKGIVALLRYDDAPSIPQNILILSLGKAKIFMRIINYEVAAYVDKKLLVPWRQTDNPTFFENELKKELSFFHPLNWKKVRAIGIRSDRDDVLFEVLNGRFKYAIVQRNVPGNFR